MAGLKMKALYNQYFCSPSARFYILAFFLAFVFLTGGSSRDDVQSLIILRPAAVIFAAYALTVADFSEWKGRLFPLYILLALAALMVIQLIPLPPSLWTQLPERELFKDIAVLAGIDQPWRPLSIAPSRTLNSLFSLSVPLAALFLYLNLPNEMRFRAIILIMIFILFSALLAIGQIAGPSKNALYLYRITNFNSPVGFFANRNHQASLLAALILLLGWYGGIINAQKLRGNVRAFGAILAIIVILPLIFITGSRAGLILSGAALPAAIWFFFKGLFDHAPDVGKTAKSKFIKKRFLILLVIMAAIFVTGFASVLFSRSLAVDRLFAESNVEELRMQLIPVLVKMATDYLPFGSGFGSFQQVYKIYEPLELLQPTYLNRAHNDWLEFLIETGLPGFTIMLSCIAWFIYRTCRMIFTLNDHISEKYTAIVALGTLVFWAAASVGDYPVRVPSIAALCIIMLSVFGDYTRGRKPEN